MAASPHRVTAQRTALSTVLGKIDEFMTAQELYDRARAAGVRIGLATVYRTLADLVASGEIDTLRGPAGETLYRQCGESEHHHHLVCRMCGHTEEVTSARVERWAQSVGEQYGFSEVGHEVELTGVCASCAATR